jgi:hypothetical protein
VQTIFNQLLGKNPISKRRRKEYSDEQGKVITWVVVQVMFGYSNVDFAEKQINTFRCSSFIFVYTEGFHTELEVEFFRTLVYIASVFLNQHHEASRRTAAEQMGSSLRSAFKFMLKKPIFPGPRILDPATLSNLVPIGNNQWDQVGIDF